MMRFPFAAPASTSRLTHHAKERVAARALPRDAVDAALDHGRRIRNRKGATLHVIGRKEVEEGRAKGIDLSDFEEVHVLVAVDDGSVITAYRNRSLDRLRPRGWRRHNRRDRKRNPAE